MTQVTYEAFSAGEGLNRQQNTIIGMRYSEEAGPARLGINCVIRSGAILYGDVEIGDHFQSGHNVLVRERTLIGDHVVLGTNSVVDGQTRIGNFVKIESNCYIPTHTQIGSRCFLGPGVTITNDRYPLKRREEYLPEGALIDDNVTIGAGVVICPGVSIGEGSFIAAGAVVTKDVPSRSLVIGPPGEVRSLPKKLDEVNSALSWRTFLE